MVSVHQEQIVVNGYGDGDGGDMMCKNDDKKKGSPENITGRLVLLWGHRPDSGD